MSRLDRDDWRDLPSAITQMYWDVDAESARILGEYFAEIGVDEPEEGGDLYTIDLETVVVICVEDDQLVVDRWSATDGRKVVRRG